MGEDGMNIVACMPVRNEEWILESSLTVALTWCDKIVILDHGSTDSTPDILAQFQTDNPDRIRIMKRDGENWDEMEHRQDMLVEARAMDATHIALIDADEILTANFVPTIRQWFKRLSNGQCVELPMVPVWNSLEDMRDDRSVWSRSQITLGFKDDPPLCYKMRDQGYQHHARPPRNASPRTFTPLRNKGGGGIMHLQFADKRRITAKHAWYKMVERSRWPNRETSGQVDHKYNQALNETNMLLREIPEEWWAHDPYVKDKIRLGIEPWHIADCARMMKEHGPGAFLGLNLFGVVE